MKTKKEVTSVVVFLCFTFLCMAGAIKYRLNQKTVDVYARVTKDVMEISNDEQLEEVEVAACAQDMIQIDESSQASETKEPETKKHETISPAAEVKDVEKQAKDVIKTVVSTMEVVKPKTTFDKVLPKVNDYVNIRTKADSDSEIAGKLYKNSYANIIERGDQWTKIKSGSVEGYISNKYLYFDEEALTVAKGLKAFQAEVTAGTVNVRRKPTTNSEVVDQVKLGDTFVHVPEMDQESWTAILYDKENELGYVSTQFVDEKFTLKAAVSAEEEKKAAQKVEEAKKEEAQKDNYTEKLEDAKKHVPSSTNRAAITVSDEELYLLATVVAMEAGGESYEGQLAVANVVINRMLDGYWGSTISDVVYAPGQFSGANSGRVEVFKKRVTESNKRAAVEALAGNNNIGNYMYFIMKNRANYSSYKKYYVLGCHCFYAR